MIKYVNDNKTMTLKKVRKLYEEAKTDINNKFIDGALTIKMVEEQFNHIITIWKYLQRYTNGSKVLLNQIKETKENYITLLENKLKAVGF